MPLNLGNRGTTRKEKTMKKLMIAAAIVCAAVAGNAASMYWGNGAYSIDNPTGTEPIDENVGGPMYKGGTMFLYLGTIGYTDGTGFTGLDSATKVISNGFDDSEYTYGNLATFGSGDVNTAEGASEAYTLILVDNATYTDLSQVKNGDYFVLRTGESYTEYDAESSSRYAVLTDDNAIAGSDWQAYSSVPEPTSGLLLLLGVAGLALKRKCA